MTNTMRKTMTKKTKHKKSKANYLKKYLAITCLMMLIAHPIHPQSTPTLTPTHNTQNSTHPYILEPGDTLEIVLIGHDHLTTKQSIIPDGTLSLPLLGRVFVAGKSIHDFQTELTTLYKPYFKTPNLIIYLTPRPIFVSYLNQQTNQIQVKKAVSAAEARALLGNTLQEREIVHGETYLLKTHPQKSFFEQNWFKFLSAASIISSVVLALGG